MQRPDMSLQCALIVERFAAEFARKFASTVDEYVAAETGRMEE